MSGDKKAHILTEIGEEENKHLLETMERLDRYTVNTPPVRYTDALIAVLKPIVKEHSSLPPEDERPTYSDGRLAFPVIFRLVRPQAMLMSKWFMVASALVFCGGLGVTSLVNGDAAKFLTNAAPILGIMTLFYEFRAKLSAIDELEATCPYSPAQLAAARLIIVLAYDTLLCLAVTPLVSYWQGHIAWQVAIRWLAPLLLMLGIALATSLRFGIMGGCLVAMAAWSVQYVLSDGGSIFWRLLPGQAAVRADLIGVAVGVALILYSYLRWNTNSQLMPDD